jgi:hypothetical protein
MNSLVRIIRDDDGRETRNRAWHLVDPCNGQGPTALCTQEFFGEGESECEFETKVRRSGGITCGDCLRIIKTYKAVKL